MTESSYIKSLRDKLGPKGPARVDLPEGPIALEEGPLVLDCETRGRKLVGRGSEVTKFTGHGLRVVGGVRCELSDFGFDAGQDTALDLHGGNRLQLWNLFFRDYDLGIFSHNEDTVEPSLNYISMRHVIAEKCVQGYKLFDLKNGTLLDVAARNCGTSLRGDNWNQTSAQVLSSDCSSNYPAVELTRAERSHLDVRSLHGKEAALLLQECVDQTVDAVLRNCRSGLALADVTDSEVSAHVLGNPDDPMDSAVFFDECREVAVEARVRDADEVVASMGDNPGCSLRGVYARANLDRSAIPAVRMRRRKSG